MRLWQDSDTYWAVNTDEHGNDVGEPFTMPKEAWDITKAAMDEEGSN